MMASEESYTRAYTELGCLIRHLPQTYTGKLPKKLIEFIQKQYDTKYEIRIDTNKRLMEQDFSEKTKDLIAIIKYNYWSTDEEKQKLNKAFYDNEDRQQMELMEKFNPNEIFNKNKQNIQQENIINDTEKIVANANTQLVEYKENFFTKIISKIKNLFIGER